MYAGWYLFLWSAIYFLTKYLLINHWRAHIMGKGVMGGRICLTYVNVNPCISLWFGVKLLMGPG